MGISKIGKSVKARYRERGHYVREDCQLCEDWFYKDSGEFIFTKRALHCQYHGKYACRREYERTAPSISYRHRQLTWVIHVNRNLWAQERRKVAEKLLKAIRSVDRDLKVLMVFHPREGDHHYHVSVQNSRFRMYRKGGVSVEERGQWEVLKDRVRGSIDAHIGNVCPGATVDDSVYVNKDNPTNWLVYVLRRDTGFASDSPIPCGDKIVFGRRKLGPKWQATALMPKVKRIKSATVAKVVPSQNLRPSISAVEFPPEINDELWSRIGPLMPSKTNLRGGRPRQDDREIVSAIFGKFRTGVAWCDLPRKSTVFRRYQELINCGAWFAIERALVVVRSGPEATDLQMGVSSEVELRG